MEFIFSFETTTPALVFPAISLLMLAYTNRFVVLADLARELHKNQLQHPDRKFIDQIANLQKRMDIIRKMQIYGALSFIFAAISMLCALLSLSVVAISTFFVSLILLITSLIYLMRELTISIDALKIQLDDLNE